MQKDETYLSKIANEVKSEIQANDVKFKKKLTKIIQLNGSSAVQSQSLGANWLHPNNHNTNNSSETQQTAPENNTNP